MNKHLHIVTHDVPWPDDHGGLVDLFYKIKELHKRGVQIHLHCFKKEGRKDEPFLEKFCVSVHYYLRTTGLAGISFRTPYIVHSRNSKRLIANLQKDKHPILLEGIHCTSILSGNTFNGRQILVRLHNVEYLYYAHMAMHEHNFFKKTYYRIESNLLKKYEKSIAKKAVFLSVSKEDEIVYKNEFKATVYFLPVFLPFTALRSQLGKGCFCLYHGNLSVNENEKAVFWLLHNVFNTLDIPFVIAGKNPSTALKALAEARPQTCLVSNPTNEEMQDLIKKAQINILPSFNSTGVKLKLLYALFNGRHCLVNNAAIAGTGLDDICTIANTGTDFKREIQSLYEFDFSENQVEKRKTVLKTYYDNNKNAEQLMSLI